jgi:hypothetical protein
MLSAAFSIVMPSVIKLACFHKEKVFPSLTFLGMCRRVN